jgi:hypothetical protein
MLADVLRTLAEDARRLLRAGGLAAAHDEGLRRRLEALRPLAERVPALAAVVAAVERVLSAGEEKAAAALLDLLVLLRPVRAALAAAGPEGELADVPASGPWATPAPVYDLHALYDLDAGGYRLNETRCDALLEASQRGRAADLRHVGPFLGLLAGGYGPMAELLFREVLPFYGRALLPDLRAVMHRHPCLLLAGYRLDRDAAAAAAERYLRGRPGLPGLLPRLGPEAVRAFLVELDREPSRASENGVEVAAAAVLRGAGDAALPVLVGLVTSERWHEWRPALHGLENMGPAASGAVPTLLPMLDDPERRVEVVRALGRVGAAEAVPHLVRLLGSGNEVERWAAMQALGQIGPAAREAVPALRQLANRWGERELQLQAMEALRGITRREGGGRA